MKVLSIDIGIKNLAMCLFEKKSDSEHFYITKWEIVNLTEKESFNCCAIDKNNKCCKPAKYKNNFDFYCLKHAKKQTLQLPNTKLKPSFIKKQTIKQLYEIASKNEIPYKKPITKDKLIELLITHYETNYLQEIETINASKIDLITIGLNIKTKLNTLFADETIIENIIIENQISPIANRMKSIQGMIVQYFIMSDIFVENIEFVSSTNKLKDFLKENQIQEKTKYSERKKMGIQKCLELLTTNHQYTDKLDYFNSHKKKDDLADTFLQGLWYITKHEL
jgi:hypothetical protein